MAQIPDIQEYGNRPAAARTGNAHVEDGGIVLGPVKPEEPQDGNVQDGSQPSPNITAEPPRAYLKGWRLYTLSFSYYLPQYVDASKNRPLTEA